MTEFPGMSFLLTQAAQKGSNTFENNSTVSYKTRGKRERRSSALQVLGRKCHKESLFSGHNTFSGGPADQLTVVYSFLSSFLSINYSYFWYQERGLIFLLGVIRVIKGFVILSCLFLCVYSIFFFLYKRKI